MSIFTDSLKLEID